MTLGKDGSQHWHTLYRKDSSTPHKPPRGTNQGIPSSPKTPFHKHLPGFPHIARDAKARGIEIINASPNSVITEFPKCNVKDLL